jgi:hypothetical protein
MTKLGSVFFIFVLIIVVFGLASFSAEFFFDRPLMALVKDFIFLLFRKQ